MRWSICNICEAYEDTLREDKSVVRMYECHCCWNNYCDKHGYKGTMICSKCLDEAYEINAEKEDIHNGKPQQKVTW